MARSYENPAGRLRQADGDAVTGDGLRTMADPVAHRWTIITRVEDLPADEADRRVTERLATQG